MADNEPVVISDSVRIFYVPLVASNAYLIETSEGLALVDAGIAAEEQAILRRMAELGWDQLCLIFITHAHLDHYGSAAALRAATGARVAIHVDNAADLAEGRTHLGMIRDWQWTKATLPYVEKLLRAPETEPDILLEDGDPITACGLDAELIHTPGHTPGSSTLLVEGKYAFVGDLISSNGQIHAQRSYAWDWSQIEHSLTKVRQRRPLMVFPGHGPVYVDRQALQDLEVEIEANE